MRGVGLGVVVVVVVLLLLEGRGGSPVGALFLDFPISNVGTGPAELVSYFTSFLFFCFSFFDLKVIK